MDDRAAWLLEMRRAMARQEDALSPDFDARWGEIEDAHRSFVGRFLDRLPPDGRVLDAACGTGKYFGMVADTGRAILGVDHSAGHLAVAAAKFPAVPTVKRDLQELAYREEFDGVMCVDTMEFVPPEEWPVVVGRFRRALRPGGWLYLTVELMAGERVRELTEQGRRTGRPLVDGEVMLDEPDGYYHHYPGMDGVRAWLDEAGLTIEDELEGPWDRDERYAYHHVLARLR
ncbi:MAG: class I SAM-dependent methyltransferase [Actinomycetota bacterium]